MPLRTGRLPEPPGRSACLLQRAGRPEHPGAAMTIVVNDQVHLSEFRPSDRAALVQHLHDRDIYDRTLRIPFPYTVAQAEDFLARVASITQEQGRTVNWAIRDADGALIGGCGFDGWQAGQSHR